MMPPLKLPAAADQTYMKVILVEISNILVKF